MKKASIFFFWLLLLTISVFTINWLKYNYFQDKFHSFFIIFQTVFFPITGTILMKYSVGPKSFKFFLFTYLSFWAVYFLLKYSLIAGNSLHLFALTPKDRFDITATYMEFTKLATPIPFIFFWILDRIFFVEEKKQS